MEEKLLNTNKTYGLVGFPLGHSFSKSFFNEKFLKEGINAEYINFEIENVEKFRDIIQSKLICGLNVTIPHKSSIIKFLDETDEVAKEIGAVNVVKFIRNNGKLILKGYNTDVIGFTNSISKMINSNHKKALILGTGGVSKAIDYSLRRIGIETKFVSRNKKPNILTYDMLNIDIMKEYTIIVNASPIGMYPNINCAPQIPYEYLSKNHIVFDTIYNPSETLFMKLASANGATVKNGLEMLEDQAIAAWNIWNDKQ